ncbi:MAG: prolipoprotein diacylglyceryl transferase family protein [Verrucomicrobiaceae bacterium]
MYPKLFNQPYLNTNGICIGIGLILCFAVGRHFVRVKKMNRDFARALERNAYFAIAFGFFSAAVFQAWYDYIEHPAAGFHITGSVTFLGGLIGGVATFLAGYFAFVRPKHGPRMVEVGAIAALCISIAQACGRVGCFFGGCCYGKPTSSWLGVRFPKLNHPAMPTQLFEAAFLFFLFAVMFHLVKRGFTQSFALYMAAYGVFRFFIEFIRDDPRGRLIDPLSPSQTISLLMIAGAMPVYFVMKKQLSVYRGNSRLTNKIF